MRRRLPWALLGLLVLVQIYYPLTSGQARASLTVTTVLAGYVLSLSHAALTRGPRAALALVATATLGGFAVEAVGVATGFPFGFYDYSGELGPKLLNVPLIIPLAWTWMAWPAWLAATHLIPLPAPPASAVSPSVVGRSVANGPPGRRRRVLRRLARVVVAAAGLAAWDLFLDPQMVAEGYWQWQAPTPALPGVPGVPIGNYLGWLGFALLLMTALAAIAGPATQKPTDGDAPIITLWLWTYASSVLAHAVFLGLPASAAWGALLMGAAVLPLAVRLIARRPQSGPPAASTRPGPGSFRPVRRRP